MAEHDAGQGLDLEVLHGGALPLREVAHLRLRELDVLEVAFRHLRDGALDVGGRELEIGRRPVVEPLGQLADGGVLALLDLRQDAFDRFAHLGVRRLDRAGVHSAFEEAGHGILLFQNCRPRESGDPVLTEFKL